ncbi:Fic family protein [Rheinheimera sp. YQF-2]|uniref:Fic family protein n=1 Tax=Rheinheimera lutimaris TaxID=2740584 RepID=A0A7Y5ATD1_9GAMM|nr:Fic family protein [Rheinheimera lutimaris]NRQ43581.1 Fic family protein [Rheinheimera lutimaris]
MNSYLKMEYFHRYLAGGPALRQGRKINRREFIIARSGIQNATPQALEVAAATHRFSSAVTLLTQITQLNLGLLSTINNTLRGKLDSPILRNKPLIFHALRAMNHYHCPVPEQAIEQTIKQLSKVQPNHSTTEQILALMAHITLNHPFTEGNGRTTRALFEALNQSCCHHTMLSPYLFVLASNRMDDFIGFLHSHQDDTFNNIGRRFINDYSTWKEHFLKQITAIEHTACEKVSNKMLFMQTGNWYHPLMHLFWQNPIISVKTIPAKVSDYSVTKHGLDILLNRQVISINTFQNELCFVANDILAAHEYVEAALFASA